MAKKTQTAADQLFAEVRNGMLEAVPTCKSCHQPMPGIKIATIAREIGVTGPTLDAYIRNPNKGVSQTVFGKFVNFLAKRREVAEQDVTAAVADNA